MTEYWKSNARKFCDFCKCWLADNKISISYHENGKRHKEKVQEHIAQVTKRSAKDHKQQLKIDDDMKKMEEAAMAAYLKDVQNNADLTSRSINEMLEKKTNCEATTSRPETAEVSRPAPSPPPAWREVKADDANIYYWNPDTNETTWEAPEKYISISELEEKQRKQEELDNKEKKSEERIKKQKQINKQTEVKNEVKAFMKREKMKERAVKSQTKEGTSSTAPVCGPAPRSDPYGSWAPVPQLVEEKIDLQLPVTNKVHIQPPVIIEPEIQFKERKVESLGEGNVDFKKRKINSNAKRNIRRKVDDD